MLPSTRPGSGFPLSPIPTWLPAPWWLGRERLNRCQRQQAFLRMLPSALLGGEETHRDRHPLPCSQVPCRYLLEEMLGEQGLAHSFRLPQVLQRGRVGVTPAAIMEKGAAF